MIVKEATQSYIGALEQEENALSQNYERLREVLGYLEELADDTVSEEKKLEIFGTMQNGIVNLQKSSGAMRFHRIQSRDAEVAMLEMGNQETSENTTQFCDAIQEINDLMMIYTNLLGRLSTDLPKVIDTMTNTNGNSNEFDVDSWKPPDEITSLLVKFVSESADTSLLHSQLSDYLNSIKMSRAKHTLVNEHSLQNIMDNLSKELIHWKKELDTMETFMFGENPNSIRVMMEKVAKMRAELRDSLEV